MLAENLIRWRKSWEREWIKQAVKKEVKKTVREEVLQEIRKEVRQELREEGQIAGMQRLLLKQMNLRFGSVSPVVRRQIREISSLPKLEALAGRLLTADSLSDLGLGQE